MVRRLGPPAVQEEGVAEAEGQTGGPLEVDQVRDVFVRKVLLQNLPRLPQHVKGPHGVVGEKADGDVDDPLQERHVRRVGEEVAGQIGGIVGLSEGVVHPGRRGLGGKVQRQRGVESAGQKVSGLVAEEGIDQHQIKLGRGIFQERLGSLVRQSTINGLD